MPELNRNFSKGRMNKDLDERLVPPGEYRDALNIEVSTSEGSDVGSVQSIMGTIEKTPGIVPANSRCVGSIVNNEENCIYYLVKGGSLFIGAPGPTTVYKDYIIKYDIDRQEHTYVFVDIYRSDVTVTGVNNVVGDKYITVGINSGIRPGMKASGIGYSIEVKSTLSFVDGISPSTNTIRFSDDQDLSLIAVGFPLTFTAQPVLEFSDVDITGLNIVDDFIMYTDGIHEPKIINIKRSILGTNDRTFNLNTGGLNSADVHTKLVSERQDGSFTTQGFEVVSSFDTLNTPVYCELENITTIKKAPLTPPSLKMSSTTQEREYRVDSSLTTNDFINADGNPIAVGTTLEITVDDLTQWDVGDKLILTQDLTQNPLAFSDSDIRVEVVATPAGEPPFNTYTVLVESISAELSSQPTFYVLLQQKDPLFEFKFCRFGYRYKYVDGQYSAFSPFSNVAFLPGRFKYYPLEGYNLGMANRLRSLKVENYAPTPADRPKDIVEIDILYKEDNSATVYTAKTITPSDGSPLWPIDNDYDTFGNTQRGSINIESELIHAVVPSNQILRPWDNVPKKAVAQEVSANRLIYGNYTQNYNLYDKFNELVTPELSLSAISKSYTDLNYSVNRAAETVKTMRTYQLGIVYRDEFGRETPVLADKEKGSVTINKEFSAHSNSLKASIQNSAPAWATSYKFFIKETADEYYNLAMDRWYNAEDGNLWLSFQSSDRNKVDIDTFIELKKAHDTDVPVLEPARYKILAIENEAPLYIKLNRQVQGLLTNASYDGTANDMVGPGGNGYPFEDYNFIIIRADEFIEAFGDNDEGNNKVYTKSSECSLKIKSIAGTRSEWYKIITISRGSFFGSADDGFKITVSKPFGPDVAFASTNGLYSGRISGLQIEITHDEYQDKPEFDGKFFVKVYKDLVLENNIMILSDDNLVVTSVYCAKYLHTYASPTAGSGSYWPSSANDAGGIDVNMNGNYVLTMAEGALHNNPFDYTDEYQWNDNANGPGSFGLDDIRPDPDFGFVGALVEFLSGEGMGIYNGQGKGETFWEDYFTEGNQATLFIDDAWATQWYTSNHELVDPLFPGPSMGDDATLSWINHAPNIDPNGNPGADFNPTNKWGGSDASGEYYNGSRGVRNFYIDLSIAGGFYGRDNVNGDPANSWISKNKEQNNFLSGLNQSIPENQALGDFINLMITPGTKWRFQKDPQKNVFTTVDHYHQWGILNTNNGTAASNKGHWYGWNKRNKFTIKADKNIEALFDPRNDMAHDGSEKTCIEILSAFSSEDSANSSDNPAIFETYPKENVGLDIYYEIDRAYPIRVNEHNLESILCIGKAKLLTVNGAAPAWAALPQPTIDALEFESNVGFKVYYGDNFAFNVGDVVVIDDGWGGTLEITIATATVAADGFFYGPINFHGNCPVVLSWFNAYSFGQGVESNRIRDDFNQPFIKNGVKASTTIAEQYKEEHRGSGMIFSGIYNSRTGVNRLNQFIQAEPITKDLNPDNGTIQKLFTRDTDIVTLCEDKILKVLSNKDALFNADGNTNVTATSKVLGQAVPFVGDYGISKNPESFAADNYRCYFADVQRGAIIRLSKDGLTPISSHGMKDYFSDTLASIRVPRLIGTFDDRKENYNITISEKPYFKGQVSFFRPITVSFNEPAKGWVSFKSYVPESGVSINNNYYTFKNGSMWQHHINPVRNMFYGVAPTNLTYSTVSMIFNDMHSSVKNFQTIKYEGSQAKINQFTTVFQGGVAYTDKEFYNLVGKDGWFVEYCESDLQTGFVPEFKNKEGKWFNAIKGECLTLDNIDQSEFTFQGIGMAEFTHSDPDSKSPDPIVINVQDSSVGNTGEVWD